MNAPERIWVDTCKDADGEPEWDTGAWGHDQQEGDEEYVRADLFAKAVEDAEKWRYAFAAQSRKLQAVLYIEGVKAVLAELEGK